MRILFIDPPFQRFMGFHRYYYPLGLAYMASVLRRNGHIISIYDAEHTQNAETMTWTQAAERHYEYPKALQNIHHPVWTEAKEVIKNFKPDVVGITALSVKMPSASLIARFCKEINQEITVIVGADHPTVFPELSLEDPNIDYVVRGEGEATVAELISYLEDKSKRSIEAISGISYKDRGNVKHNPNRELIKNLDELPFPAIDLLLNNGSYRLVDFGAILASRGCPYMCTFCGVQNIWTRRVRYRSSDNVVAEMKWLKEEYGTSYFSFRDASFTLNRGRVIKLCRAIVCENLDIQWEFLTRADLIDKESLIELKKAGCVTIRLGIESGSPKILQEMKKEISLDAITKAADLLHKHNFYWSAYFLFGTPNETRETISQTLEFIREINPPFVTLSRFAPIPGTEMYSELMRAGLISPMIDWSMENNQQLHSNYVFSMSDDEFENSMRQVSDFIEEHNRLNSVRLKMRDMRLK